MFLRFANDPHPDNPHTSALSSMGSHQITADTLENLITKPFGVSNLF